MQRQKDDAVDDTDLSEDIEATQEEEQEQEEEKSELTGTGVPTVAVPPKRGEESRPLLPHDDPDAPRDPEARAAYERKKRTDLEEHYHVRLQEKDAEIDDLKRRLDKVEGQSRQDKTTVQAQRTNLDTQGKELTGTMQKVKDLEQKMKMFQTSYKNDQNTLKGKEVELKNMQQKKAEFFQEKKKALSELADARATVQGLHEQIDQLEKTNAEQRQQLQADAAYKTDMQTVHDMLEATFTEVKSENLPTPEFVQKIQEWQNSIKRTDSHTSMGREKEAPQSLENQLDGLGYNSSEEDVSEDEDEDEGDRTLTVDVEMAELKQENEQLEKDVMDGKVKQEEYLDRIAVLVRELEGWRKWSVEERRKREDLSMSRITAVEIEPVSPPKPKKKPEQKFDFSRISSVDIEPVEPSKPKQMFTFTGINSVETAPVEPSKPTPKPAEEKKLQQTLGFSSTTNNIDIPPSAPKVATTGNKSTNTTTTYTPPAPKIITVTRDPTIHDIYLHTPFWALFLLGLMLAALAYCWWSTLEERAIWLGANDALRTGALRVEMGRRTAMCGSPGTFGEGLLGPLWMAVQRWLGLPMPVMLT